ncbi:MAG: phytochelatin synthase family protein [Phormidesmis sp.]
MRTLFTLRFCRCSPLMAIALASFSLATAAPRLSAQTLPLPEQLTNLSSPAGQSLLRASEAQTDFVPLMSQYVTQENQAFCGIASMVMVLNSAGIPAPNAPAWDRGYVCQLSGAGSAALRQRY